MREVRSTLERLFMSPLTIPLLTGIAVLSLLLSTLTLVRYANDQGERAAESEQAEIEACRSANALRHDIAQSSESVEALIRSILNVVLRPGEGDAERQLAVRGVYDQMRPEFERYAAAVDSIDNPRNCKEGQ